MAFDDRLRQLLEERAGEATPSPEAWERMERRLRMRPYVRALAIAISVAAIAGIAFAAPKILDRSRVTILTPASTPSPTGAPPDTSGVEFSNNAFWPLSDEESARQYQAEIDDGTDAWMRDPEQVAEHFAVAFIGWRSIVSSHDVGYDEVGTLRRATFHIRPILAAGNGQPGPRHTIRLVALPKAENPGWYISELVSDNIVLDQPLQATEITSPVTTKGRGVGFEAILNPEVRDDSGTKLHPRFGKDLGYLMAGATEIQPFEAALEYNNPTTPRGVVIVVSSSGLEGPSGDWTIVRVRFATTATTSPSPKSAPYAEDDAADLALRCFFAARVGREFVDAKKCMTERFAASWDEGTFMGPANPHITRFTILSDNSRTKDEASVSVRTFQGYGDSPADSYTVDTFVVLKQGSRWLVDSWKQGPSTSIQGATAVKVFYLNPQAPAQCPGDAGYDSAWTYQTRAIPKEGPGKQAMQELFTGPLSRKSEPTLTSALPAASRLVSLRIENGAAHVDVSRATEIGGGSCSMGLRVDQIRKTLMQFPSVERVNISVEGRTGDVIFQP